MNYDIFDSNKIFQKLNVDQILKKFLQKYLQLSKDKNHAT